MKTFAHPLVYLATKRRSLFQDGYPEACIGRNNRGSKAARPTTDYRDVNVRHDPVLLLCLLHATWMSALTEQAAGELPHPQPVYSQN